jgi:hypothetical protein
MGSVDIGDSLFPRITISFITIWCKDAITCGRGATIRKVDSAQADMAASTIPINGHLKFLPAI